MEFYSVNKNETLLTNRLYFGSSEKDLNPILKSKEYKGFGTTIYGNILGRFLALIGFAFETKDEKGNELYVNKKSFFRYTSRMVEANKKHSNTGQITKEIIDSVENHYLTEKTSEDLKKIENISNIFHQVISDFSGKKNNNIANIYSTVFIRV